MSTWTNLDGIAREELVTTRIEGPNGIAISGRKMYWTDYARQRIERADLDGRNREELVTAGLSSPIGIAIDGGKMYWTDAGTEKIERANLDGTGRGSGPARVLCPAVEHGPVSVVEPGRRPAPG